MRFLPPPPPQQWKTFPRLHLLAWDTERPHLCLQIKHVTDFVMNILKAFPRGLTGSCQMYNCGCGGLIIVKTYRGI